MYARMHPFLNRPIILNHPIHSIPIHASIDPIRSPLTPKHPHIYPLTPLDLIFGWHVLAEQHIVVLRRLLLNLLPALEWDVLLLLRIVLAIRLLIVNVLLGCSALTLPTRKRRRSFIFALQTLGLIRLRRNLLLLRAALGGLGCRSSLRGTCGLGRGIAATDILFLP
jgi:hypothetical protein